jgi:signal transduction histidine kinase
VKLGSKITLGITLLVTSALAVYGWVNVTGRRDDLIAEMEREVRAQGTALQEAIEQATHAGRSQDEIRRLVDRMARAERTLAVTVFNRQGTQILPLPGEGSAGTARKTLRNVEDWNRVRWVLESGRATQARNSDERLTYSFYFPILDTAGDVAGAVRVTREAGYLEGYVKATRDRMMTAMAALVLGLAAAVFLAVRQALGRPISWLVEGIDNVARGDLEYTFTTDRQDEIGAIAARFNAMTAQLKRAREEIVQANHDRLDAERRLRQSEKLAAIGQLAAQLAHEVGTPLNVIGGRARNLVKKADDPGQVEKNASIIAEQTARITRIIRQLLDVARRRAPEHEPLQLARIAESTLAFLSEELGRQQVMARVEVRPEVASLARPLVVKGDTDGLTQVVLNLCVNALQSMPHGGNLNLSIGQVVRRKRGLDHTPEVPHLVLEVADTGLGIPEEHKAKVFEPFFTHRPDGENSGTGLGLPVALGIVKDHDGWIEFESEVGRGSRFQVFLPAAQVDDGAVIPDQAMSRSNPAPVNGTSSPVPLPAAAPANDQDTPMTTVDTNGRGAHDAA